MAGPALFSRYTTHTTVFGSVFAARGRMGDAHKCVCTTYRARRTHALSAVTRRTLPSVARTHTSQRDRYACVRAHHRNARISSSKTVCGCRHTTHARPSCKSPAASHARPRTRSPKPANTCTSIARSLLLEPAEVCLTTRSCSLASWWCSLGPTLLTSTCARLHTSQRTGGCGLNKGSGRRRQHARLAGNAACMPLTG